MSGCRKGISLVSFKAFAALASFFNMQFWHEKVFCPILLLCSLLLSACTELDDLTKAAEQGDVLLQIKLGFMYTTGEGVAEDGVEAMKWFRKAAEQGYAMVQVKLGFMYATGQGVAEDAVEAYKWFNLAAAQGYEDAETYKDILSARMTKEQIAAAQELSREWLAKRSK